MLTEVTSCRSDCDSLNQTLTTLCLVNLVFFGDHEIAEEILGAKTQPHQKKLGREVRNFDEKRWNDVCCDIVKKGNMAKVWQLHYAV